MLKVNHHILQSAPLVNFIPPSLPPFLPSIFHRHPLQLFAKELQQWQGQVDQTNAMADKLLTLYANDDTHRVTQVNDNMAATWAHISKR